MQNAVPAFLELIVGLIFVIFQVLSTEIVVILKYRLLSLVMIPPKVLFILKQFHESKQLVGFIEFDLQLLLEWLDRLLVLLRTLPETGNATELNETHIEGAETKVATQATLQVGLVAVTA